MSVKMRQLVEREIAEQVVTDLLAAGYALGVNDGEEITIHHSLSKAAILAAMFTTDEDYLYVYAKGDAQSWDDINKEDETPDYWVRFVYGNDGWDVINDYITVLEPVIGEGTKTQALIDKYSD